MCSNLIIQEEVRAALEAKKPVVALESTILSHGLPFPENLSVANQLEQTIRQEGSIPATIAVIYGRPHIGLTKEQLRLLCTGRDVRKLALRDLPHAFASGHHGATTVSATLQLAYRAGISVFATGGIGGVHRGVANSWDISADIEALARYPVLVVSAGAKSILDIGKTLEALESASVPVLVLKSPKFPAFYTRDSGHRAPSVVQSTIHAARAFCNARASGLPSGILLAVPIPREHEANGAIVSQAIESAIEELKQNPKLAPNEVTPFLLKRVVELSGGATLKANVHLVRNNARVAAIVATHLSKMRISQTSQTQVPWNHWDVPKGKIGEGKVDLVVIGAAVLDILSRVEDGVSRGSTAVGRIQFRAGGVGFNVALAAARWSSAKVRLVTAVGGDSASSVLNELLRIIEKQENKLEIRVQQISERRGSIVSLIQESNGDLSVSTQKLKFS